MKVIALIFMALFVVMSTEAAPKKDSCQIACASDYTPICGKPAEGKGTDITFVNQCVLDNYNCEKKDKPYVKSSNGECPGKAPVRL